MQGARSEILRTSNFEDDGDLTLHHCDVGVHMRRLDPA